MKEKIGAEVYNNTEHKKLAYTEDFKEWIKANPGVIEDFNQLIAKLDTIPLSTIGLKNVQNKEVVTEGPITATIIDTYTSRFGKRYYYFKLDIGEDSFFVKSKPKTAINTKGEGYDEFKSTSEAKQKIKDIPWVEVIEFQVGYQDNKGNTFFVSKWRDLPRLDLHIKDLRDKGQNSEVADLSEKVGKLRELLPDFLDFKAHNMMYDPEAGKIVLFDLSN